MKQRFGLAEFSRIEPPAIPSLGDLHRNSAPEIASLEVFKLFRRARAAAALLDLRGDLSVDVLQRDRVDVGELDVVEGHRESLVVHYVEIPDF